MKPRIRGQSNVAQLLESVAMVSASGICSAGQHPPSRTLEDPKGLIHGRAMMDDARIDWHLWNWERWMQDGRIVRGYPSRASVGGSTASRDFDAMVADADNRCAMACDAIIESLPLREHAAVYSAHLTAVRRVDLTGAYDTAKAKIGRSLDRRGVI